MISWLNTLRLNSSSPQQRQKAIEGLAGSNKARDTERIVASLLDENPQVRCAAVRALERAPTGSAVTSLIGALRDENYQVRQSAARALGRLRNPKATEPLALALKDPDPAVRAAVAGALRALAWKPSTKEDLARFEIALGNTPAAVSAGDGGIDSLAPEPRFDTSFHRRAAEEALKELNDPRKIKVLLTDLESSDPGIRIAAIHALGSVTGDTVTRKILARFRDKDPDVRLAAIQEMAARNDPAPAHFVGLLDDANHEVRLAAVEFLGRVRHPQIAEVILPLLSDSDPKVRRATAKALGSTSNTTAVESLVLCLADEDHPVRLAAEEALDQLDPNWMLTTPTQRAREQMEASLSTCPPSARAAIQRVLAALPAPTLTEVSA